MSALTPPRIAYPDEAADEETLGEPHCPRCRLPPGRGVHGSNRCCGLESDGRCVGNCDAQGSHAPTFGSDLYDAIWSRERASFRREDGRLVDLTIAHVEALVAAARGTK